jgi:hypothetical protein
MFIISFRVASFRCLARTYSYLSDRFCSCTKYIRCMPRVQPGKSVFTRLVSCWLIMYKTWFFFSTIVFCLSFIGGDETIILVKKYYIVSVFTNFSLLTYCSYPWLRLLARHRRRMQPWSQPSTWLSRLSRPVVISLGSGCGALLVSPERALSSSFPAAQHQLWWWGNPTLFNPTGFQCMVAADGDLLCSCQMQGIG